MAGGDNTYVEPEYDVTVDWVARAPGKLFVTGGVNNDGVLEGACSFIIGALASIHSLFVTLCHAMQAKFVMPREWSVVRHRPLFSTPPTIPALSQLFPYHVSYFPLPQFPLSLRAFLSPSHSEHTPSAARTPSPSLHTTPARSSPEECKIIYDNKASRSSRRDCCTFPTRIQRLHVEDVDALHFAEDFEPLEAGGLVEVGGDGARFGARGEQVFFRSDICVQRVAVSHGTIAGEAWVAIGSVTAKTE